VSPWESEIRKRLKGLSLDPARENALIEEFGQHLEDCYVEFLGSGQSPEKARRAALAELSGNPAMAQEFQQLERTPPPSITPGVSQRSHMIQQLGQDLRFGLRMLWKTPVVTAIAILSLAIGVGANTAIFSLIDATMLRRLPVKDPQGLALFFFNREGKPDYLFSLPAYERLRDNQKSLNGLLAVRSIQRMRLQTPEGVETVEPEQVSGNYFSVLGVPATLGRMLTEADDNLANPQAVVVLSHEFWRRRFGLDPSVIGRTLTLDEYPFTIVGVAPAGFSGIEIGRRPDFWSPLQAIPLAAPDRAKIIRDEGYTWLKVIGRLQPGATLAQAQAEISVLFNQQVREYIANRPGMSASERRKIETWELRLESGATGWSSLRQRFKKPLVILMIVVGLVLLVACANVAGVLLARGMARRKEMGVRLALGARRSRLLRQLLTESMLLSLFGGAAGVLFANWGVDVLLEYLPRQNTPLALGFRLDLRMLGFTLAASLLTGLVFGLASALQSTGLDVNSSLRDQPGASLRWPLHKSLVVLQTALALFLLIGAGLFIRSLQNLKAIDLGFDRENLLQFRLETGKGTTPAQRVNLYKQMLARLEALPGARAASFSSFPLLSGNRVRGRVIAANFVGQSEGDALSHMLTVGPNYFAAMGMGLLSGREFGLQDQRTETAGAAETTPLAVINQTMARRFFGEDNPIGKSFRVDRPENRPYEIIGVVGDAKYLEMREPPPPTYYLPWLQNESGGPQHFQLRTSVDPNAMISAVRRVAAELDPKIQVLGMQTMREQVDELLVQERSIAQLAGFFSLFALLLANLGLYGVMSQAVSRRVREIGVRMALGADRRDVIRMILRESMTLVIAGAAIGLIAAILVTRLAATMLFGLTPTDPMTMAVSVLLMLTVAVAAVYSPARRASRVDPMTALRAE
jgi:predicted permease